MSKIKKLLAATDFSDNAQQAATRAAMLASASDAKLELLHVMSSSSLDDLRQFFGLSTEADDKLKDEALQTLKSQAQHITQQTGQTITPQLRVGQTDSEILSAAEDADKLVIGARGANPLRDIFLGTTAEKLLRKSSCPVLVNKRPPLAPYQRVMVTMDLVSDSAAALEMARRIAPDASAAVVHVFSVPFEGKLWVAGVSDAD
ncbi:MAG: universal stress protein, partial [Gallionellaceae bacterium]|nr:universal stress protein [Gallionellaceae bacterium]